MAAIRLVLIFTFLLMVEWTVEAQIQQPGRLEIILDEEDERFNVQSAEDNGIVLYRTVRNRDTRTDYKYQIILVDTAMKMAWEEHYFISLKYVQIGFEYAGDYLYLLFQQNTESLRADLFVFRVNLDTRQSETFLIERDFMMELSQFEVVGNTLIFGGYSNNLPTIVCYEFGKSQPKVLPGFYNEKSQIQHLETDDEHKIFNVLTTFRTRDGRKSLSYNSYTEQGELIKNINLQPSEEWSLLFGRVVTIDREVSIIVGTFTRKMSDLSRGIFLARVSPEGDQVINYYNYADLKNFFSYMKAKREKNIKERIERRNVRGKKNRFNYRLMVHDVVDWEGKFIMVGEAYYPKYNQGYYSAPGAYYNPTYNYGNSYTTNFEGYKFTHAVVFGFDRRGRLLWDNSFQIEDVVSYDLDQHVQVSLSQEQMALLYMFEDEIRTKTIKGNEVVEGKVYDELKRSFEFDMVDETDMEYGGLEKWYGGHLFAYGVQTIKNSKDEGVKLNRDVFFLNKIVYK